jgi:hypothetical protein
VIQLKAKDNVHWGHSMIIYSQNFTCNGKHKGTEHCPYSGKKEMLYAQHSDPYDQGHLRKLLKETPGAVIFTKIKNDV